MSEMRFNPVTRDWVIMAESRAGKPYDFSAMQSARHTEKWRENCPFCLGNEAQTTDDLARVDDDAGDWRIRVVYNKFPALHPHLDAQRESKGTFLSMPAAGHHEVVIEHPRHDMTLAAAGPDHLAQLIAVYRERYVALRQIEAVQSITVFRNHGVRAGTSLEHPHSQIVGAPIVPPQVRLRLQDASRYHDETGSCLFCCVIDDELQARERLVEASPHFVAFVPHAALSPYHMWIFPRRHAASFDAILDEEIDDLAAALSRMAIRMRDGVGDPDFNLSIRSAPTGATAAPHYHWYISLVPRVSRLAGFEMGSGMYINPVLPEQAAADMRAVGLE